jgi:hypothetical protein
MNADPLILQMKYAEIIHQLAEQLNISFDESLKIFYTSRLYQLLKDGVSDMHCLSEGYLVEDLISEWTIKNGRYAESRVLNPEGNSVEITK